MSHRVWITAALMTAFVACGAHARTTNETALRRVRGVELERVVSQARFETIKHPLRGNDSGTESYLPDGLMYKWISLGFAGSLYTGKYRIVADQVCINIPQADFARCTSIFAKGRNVFSFENHYAGEQVRLRYGGGGVTRYDVNRVDLLEEMRRNAERRKARQERFNGN